MHLLQQNASAFMPYSEKAILEVKVVNVTYLHSSSHLESGFRTIGTLQDVMVGSLS